MLSAAPFAAMLVRRGPLDAKAYAALATELVNVGQGAGCAVLVEDDAALAKRIGADGVHVSGDLKSVRDAIAAVKPALIVGAGPFTTRHQVMTVGEQDVDYVLFGALDGASDSVANDLAQWWAETFEIPAVLSDPVSTPETANDHGAEFYALSASLWADAAPGQALAAIAKTLEA